MTFDRKTWGRRVGPVAVLATLALAACGGSEANGNEADASGAEASGEAFSRVINVETETLAPRSFIEVLDLTGTVEANRDVTVSAEEGGVIREVFVDKGAAVGAGQAIAKIDDRILTSQVAQAQAQAALAEETWQRRKRLYEEDSVGSELAYLEARYTADQARANLATLQERLERTVVRAPIGGLMDDRMVEVGTMVSPGTAVARIVDLDPVKITAGVPERFARDVQRGAEVRVSFDVLDGQGFDGRISYVGAAVNPSNRTFPVELLLPNPGRAIKPEMVAEVELTRRTVGEAIVVPQESLVRVENGFVAFVVEERDGAEIAVARTLTLGPTQRNEVVVEQGLDVGDRLVVLGQKQVADGDRVRIVGGEG